MIVAILNVYLVLLFILVKMHIVRFTLFWKISPLIVLCLLMFGLFIPMGWGAPQGPALVIRPSVAIVPNVSGEVIDVAVQPNTPLKTGDVLFQIDPIPYQAQVDVLVAQFTLADLRLKQMTQLLNQDSGRAFDVQQRQSEVDEIKAKIENAKWNLDKTTVRAPSEGYVTNLALRKGARVSNLPLSPVMAFIDTSATLIGVEVQQIDARYLKPGQPIEATFKFRPGKIYTGTVEEILQATSLGQIQTSGAAVTPRAIEAGPFVVRIKLDDADFARSLPAGSVGAAAIFTDYVKAAHVIRKVLLRQIAIMNYVNPF